MVALDRSLRTRWRLVAGLVRDTAKERGVLNDFGDVRVTNVDEVNTKVDVRDDKRRRRNTGGRGFF